MFGRQCILHFQNVREYQRTYGGLAQDPSLKDLEGCERSEESHDLVHHVIRNHAPETGNSQKWNLSAPLPKLPVPELQPTLEKYLETVKPVVSADQYARTRTLVEEFGQSGGQGEQLQKKLLEFADKSECWANEFWYDDMYMKVKLPLPVNSNPGMAFPRQVFREPNDSLRFAARLISGIMDYKVILDTRTLPVDRCRHREKGQPMCMEQYYRLFPSYRMPGVEKDKLTQPALELDEPPTHIIVICRNQFFVLDLFFGSSRLSDDNIYAQLKKISQMASEEESGAPKVGILTSAYRDRWAKNRLDMLRDPTNVESLRMIETCMFVLCLDKCTPLSFNHQRSVTDECGSRDDVSLAMQMLHGTRSKLNSCNRWFEKTMQFIIGEDGACGLCYEHSASEGIAVVQLIEHLLKYMDMLQRKKLARMMSLCDLPDPPKLQWNITDQIHEEIGEAASALDKLIDTLDLYVLRFTQFGKNFPKSQNMSPDAFIQLALQLTYYKVHKHLVPTYESASIRRYRQGRVDNIRACTWEALEWCQAMVGETQATEVEKMSLLRRAIKKQTNILVDTILGQGIDNHLLALREIAHLNGIATPGIFEDETYLKSNKFTLSTSQVPTTMDCFMCYGPVVPDGYGACYNPHEDYLLCVISSFNRCDHTASDFFALSLEESLLEMKEVCVRGSQMAGGGAASQNGAQNGEGSGKSKAALNNNNA